MLRKFLTGAIALTMLPAPVIKKFSGSGDLRGCRSRITAAGRSTIRTSAKRIVDYYPFARLITVTSSSTSEPAIWPIIRTAVL